MQIRIISQTEVRLDDLAVDLQPQMASAVATLVVAGGHLSVDRLKRMLWDDAAEGNRQRSLIKVMSKLRGSLGERRVLFTKTGYTLVIGKDDYVDLRVFRGLVERADWARRNEDYEVAASLYESALQMWQEPYLDNLPRTLEMSPYREALETLRQDTYEAHVEVRMLLGQNRALAREIPAALAADPTNEYLASQLMLVLYRAGRKAQAIGVYRTSCERIAAQTDSNAGPVLQQMHDRIIANDPVLQWTSPPIRPSDARVHATGADSLRHRHSRMLDYQLGGDYNLPVDRAAVELIQAVAPNINDLARANEAFVARAIRLAAKSGIQQYIEFGSGMPSRDGAHIVARRVALAARVVYATSDPSVVKHSRNRLTDELTAIFHAEMLNARDILEAPEVLRLIDFREPVALLYRDALNYIPDHANPEIFISRLVAACTRGSYLVIANATSEGLSDVLAQQVEELYRHAPLPLILRSRRAIEELFGRLPLLDPGVTRVDAWRTERPMQKLPMLVLGGVAVKGRT